MKNQIFAFFFVAVATHTVAQQCATITCWTREIVSMGADPKSVLFGSSNQNAFVDSMLVHATSVEQLLCISGYVTPEKRIDILYHALTLTERRAVAEKIRNEVATAYAADYVGKRRKISTKFLTYCDKIMRNML